MSVMNVKRATQTFSKSDQGPVAKGEGAHSGSAAAAAQAFGDQSLGDIANKASDPNYVDPTKKVRAVGNNQLDKDAFLKLMLTQMKYQDPTNPMQSHEMAAQLAQFTSLEQLNNIHMTLESMKNNQAPQTNYQALALIGKRVSGDSSKLTRAVGDTKHGVSFDLLGDTTQTKVTIKDAAGNAIRKLIVPNLKKGRNSIEWNGLKDDGTAAHPGEYKVSVEGISSAGKKVFAKTDFGGRITGLNYTADGPVLMVGNQTVKLSDVKKIEDAGPEEVAPAVPLGVGQGGAPGVGGGPASALGGKMSPSLAPVMPASMLAGMQMASNGAPGAAIPAQLAPMATSSPMDKFLPINGQMAPAPEPITVAPPPPGPAPTLAVPETPPASVVNPPAAPIDGNVPPAEEVTQVGNIDSVPMSSELISKLAKTK